MGNLFAMIAQPFVPGPLYALMSQATLPSAAAVSYLFLHRRYSVCQLLAILCVMMGGVLALLPELIEWAMHGDKSQSALKFRYSLLVVVGTVPTALSSALKEKVFKLYSRRQANLVKIENNGSYKGVEIPGQFEFGPRPRKLSPSQDGPEPLERLEIEGQQSSECTGEGNSSRTTKNLDIFIISAFGSLFQAIIAPLAFPINVATIQVSHSLNCKTWCEFSPNPSLHLFVRVLFASSVLPMALQQSVMPCHSTALNCRCRATTNVNGHHTLMYAT